MRNIIITSAIAGILGSTSFNANATGIANGDTLALATGSSELTGCLLGTPLPCTDSRLEITTQTGSYFYIGGRTTNLKNNNGLILGTSQLASGAHAGSPDGSESPGIDAPWEISSNTGMHQSTSPVSVISQTELDFTGWNATWFDNPSIVLGGCLEGDPANNSGFSSCDPDQDGIDNYINTGIANITVTGDTYVLDYFANIPAGDPSGLGGASYTLHLEGAIVHDVAIPAALGTIVHPVPIPAALGAIVHPVPIPAAVWLFTCGILVLSGVARHRSET